MQNEKQRKIIVAVAPVGGDIAPPSENPRTPEQVAGEVIRCAKAGAGLVHLHVRDSEGHLTEDLSNFSRTLDIIRESSDIVIEGSTGGLSSLTLEQRCVAINDPRVEMASLNMGSVNFGEDVYINRLPDIRYWSRRMAEAGVVPGMVVFEIGMIGAARSLVAEGAIKPPYGFACCLGAPWGLQADPGSLFYFKTTLHDEAPWSIIHDKMQDFSLLASAIALGATMVRVGFEDSVYFSPGRVASNNVELVQKVVALIHQLGFGVAEPETARQLLGLT